jgi:hypothetical protein
MRAFSISSAWIILGMFLTFLCIVSLRLGLKASSLTETDIIMHYSTIYLENERAEGRIAHLTDCYALARTEIWERMEVICVTKNVIPYRYVIGFWGQLMHFSRSLNTDFVPRA